MSRTYPVTFYNLDNNRDPERMEKEVRALLDPRPAILGLCEALGYPLPGVEDYRILRDTSTKSRANIAAYVKTNLEVSDVKWLDLKETWTRTNPGATGQHEPRSYLEFRAAKLHVWVAHQAPKGTDNTKPAQQEGIDKLTARMAPWTRDDWDDRTDEDQKAAKAQPRLLLWDANRHPDESAGQPGPAMLSKRIGGYSAGSHIDGAVYRKGDCSGISYPGKVAGVELRSDHGCAFMCDITVDE